MGREKRKENSDGFYEAEVLKNEIISYFCDYKDFDFFLELLKKETIKKEIEIISYAFLKDSIGFILKTEKFSEIPLFIGNILRQYSRYYKRKYNYDDKVFKKRYKLMSVEEKELPSKVIMMHNKLLKSGYDEKESRYSSFSDYFSLHKDDKICNIDEVYSQISKNEFFLKQYCSDNTEGYEIKQYICNELKTDNYKDIKTAERNLRNSVIESLYFNKKVKVSVISRISGFSRQTIYTIIKKKKVIF